MKKVIFGTALASMALLSACSSDNELANVGTTANNAIGFHVVGNKAETRATPITPDNITTTDFYVYAYIKNAEGKDGSPFMGGNDNEPGNYGINISYKSGNWSYTNPGDIRYWPTSDTKLNFYAVNTGSTPPSCSRGNSRIPKKKSHTFATMSTVRITSMKKMEPRSNT